MSVRFLKAILEEWGVVQSVSLGDMLSYLSTHDNSSSSSSSSSSSNNCSSVLEEICTVCGASIIFTLPSKEEGSAVSTSTCKSCGTFFDRCCTTFLTIGFDAMMTGDVLICTVCSSTGLLHRSDKSFLTSTDTKNATATAIATLDTNKKKSRLATTSKNVNSEDSNEDSNDEAVDSRKEFDWFWWDRKAPYCPYCSILMLPLV